MVIFAEEMLAILALQSIRVNRIWRLHCDFTGGASICLAYCEKTFLYCEQCK